MTEQDRKRALELLTHFGRYGGHLSSCVSNLSFGNPASDYCNCGLSDAKKSFNELVTIVKSG